MPSELTRTRWPARARSLRRRYGVPVNWFCYPSGHYNATVIDDGQGRRLHRLDDRRPGLGQPDRGSVPPAAAARARRHEPRRRCSARSPRPERRRRPRAVLRRAPAPRERTVSAGTAHARPASAAGDACAPRGPSLALGIAASVLRWPRPRSPIYALKHVAPVVSLSVVYLPAVLLVVDLLGPGARALTALAAQRRRVQLLPPAADRPFTIADRRNWVALAAFIVVAVAVSTIAELARSRALEAERRRAEADLAAALARELLLGDRTPPRARGRRPPHRRGARDALRGDRARHRAGRANDGRAFALRAAGRRPDRDPARPARPP